MSLALARRLRKQNIDQSWYSPRVTAVVADVLSTPQFYYVTLDDNALHHFPRGMFIGDGARDSLSAILHLPVFAFLPEQCEDLRDALAAQGATLPYGVTYAVALSPIKLLRQAVAPQTPVVRLPKIAPLDLTQLSADKLLVPIGETESGPLVKPLPALNHVLIVGETQCGKSRTAHAMLKALTQLNAPARFRFALVDPKRSEFSFWSNAPHRWGDVAHTTDEAIELFRLVNAEIQQRGDRCKTARRLNIADYNALAGRDPLPYLVVVIDETLLLLNQGRVGKAAGDLIENIATTGLGFGVMLWIITQHVSSDGKGVPRIAVSNLQTRLGFHMQDATAAYHAGVRGAEALPLIKGRMLAKVGERTYPVQGYFVTDDELRAIAELYATDASETSTATSKLSDQDRTLIDWALEQPLGQGGHYDLTLSSIQTALGVSNREARRIADRYALNGWTVKDPKNRNIPYLTRLAE